MLYIATLADIKADLGLTDTKDDDMLTRMLEGLQDRFADHCCVATFLRSEVSDEEHDGGCRTIYARRPPLESCSLVTVDGVTLTENVDYHVSEYRSALRYLGAEEWPETVGGILVTYIGGYAARTDNAAIAAGAKTVPENLRRCILMQAGYEYRNRVNLGRSAVSAGGASINLSPAALLPDVKTGLHAYRRYA